MLKAFRATIFIMIFTTIVVVPKSAFSVPDEAAQSSETEKTTPKRYNFFIPTWGTVSTGAESHPLNARRQAALPAEDQPDNACASIENGSPIAVLDERYSGDSDEKWYKISKFSNQVACPMGQFAWVKAEYIKLKTGKGSVIDKFEDLPPSLPEETPVDTTIGPITKNQLIVKEKLAELRKGTVPAPPKPERDSAELTVPPSIDLQVETGSDLDLCVRLKPYSGSETPPKKCDTGGGSPTLSQPVPRNACAKLPNGTKLKVIGYDKSRDWLEVSFEGDTSKCVGGKTGWVSSAYTAGPNFKREETGEEEEKSADDEESEMTPEEQEVAEALADVCNTTNGCQSPTMQEQPAVDTDNFERPVRRRAPRVGSRFLVGPARRSRQAGTCINCSTSPQSRPGRFTVAPARDQRRASVDQSRRHPPEQTTAIELPGGAGDLAWQMPTTYKRITSELGACRPTRKNRKCGRSHAGIDLANDEGTPIKPVMEGEVVESKRNNGLYGGYIKIQHPNGCTSVYGHFSPKCPLKALGHVEANAQIGCMGHTGDASGNHLHLEIRCNGKLQNPRDFLPGL